MLNSLTETLYDLWWAKKPLKSPKNFLTFKIFSEFLRILPELCGIMRYFRNYAFNVLYASDPEVNHLVARWYAQIQNINWPKAVNFRKRLLCFLCILLALIINEHCAHAGINSCKISRCSFRSALYKQGVSP
jgi:hypothetical protein